MYNITATDPDMLQGWLLNLRCTCARALICLSRSISLDIKTPQPLHVFGTL